MQTDKLEKFIIDRRNEFDDLQPSPGIWEKIELRKPKTIQLDWKRIIVRVAAVVVIFVASYFFHDFMQNRNNEQNLASETSLIEDRQMYTDLMEAEVYYTSMIDSKKTEFYEMASGQPMLREEISKELSELDRDYRDLKEDLSDNADNEEVIVAMIQNYRLKLRILEETLAQLQQSKNVKNEKDENKTVSF